MDWIRAVCTEYNCHIVNSYKVPKAWFAECLERFRVKNTRCKPLWQRTTESLEAEWGVHNVLYRLGIFRNRTKDVDLNFPQRWDWLYRIVWALTKWIAR